MNFDKYTIKSQQTLQKAADIAGSMGQQAIEPGHVLKALLMTDENVISFLVK
ncbi:MAG: Clp protease N-terminal domain-containing protein, partial [Bacteroidota bacterium]